MKKFALSAFWLPQQESWVQTVLRTPAPGVAQQAMRLADETDHTVALFFGAVAFTEDESAYVYFPHSLYTGQFSSRMKWAECLQCGSLSIVAQGRSDQFSCRCLHMARQESQMVHDSPRLLHAYRQAGLPRSLPLPVPSQDEMDATHPLSIIAFSKRNL